MADNTQSRSVPVRFCVNGVSRELTVDPRYALADVLRDELSLTGLHLGCEQGVCGACMVMIDGEPALSCLTLAVEAQGCDIQTVEHLAAPGTEPGPLGKSFIEHCAFQCGFCTPGVLVIAHHILNKGIGHDREKVREHLSGNICRCTGYEPIIDAIVAASKDWKVT
jgi:aerobic carbon-monoxide dehydrogenase small subunit